MNKYSKYFYGGALMLALAACSSDEPKLAETPKFEGD